MIGKLAKDLALNDEFDSFCDRAYRRVRIVKVPYLREGAIELVIAPVRKLRATALIRLQPFQQVQVHPDRTPSLDERYQAAILMVLEEGDRSLTAWEIFQRIQARGLDQRLEITRFLLPRLKTNCKKLVGTRLVRRAIGHVPAYRLAIAHLTGLAVVEHPETSRERFGWIKGVQLHQPTGTYFPVVEWERGGSSFAHEEHLEPVTGADLRRLKNIQLLRAGQLPEGRVEISPLLFYEWRSATRERERSAVLLHIAQKLGWVDWDRERLSGGDRNRVLAYLDTWYPGWRTGLAA